MKYFIPTALAILLLSYGINVMADTKPLPTLNIALHNANPPFAIINPDNGQISGIIPDIITVIATRAGFTPSFSGLPYKRIQLGMRDGLVDLGVMYTQPESESETRGKYQCFSPELLSVPIGIYGKKISTEAIPRLGIFALAKDTLKDQDIITISDRQYQYHDLGFSHQAYKLIAANRLDYVLTSAPNTAYWYERLGIRLVKIFPLGNAKAYLCASRQSAYTPEKLKIFERIATQLQAFTVDDINQIAERWEIDPVYLIALMNKF